MPKTRATAPAEPEEATTPKAKAEAEPEAPPAKCAHNWKWINNLDKTRGGFHNQRCVNDGCQAERRSNSLT